MSVRIMIFEDEGIIAQDLKLRLEKLGYVVPAMAVSGKNVLAKVGAADPDLIFMDIMLKGRTDGIDLAGKIKEHFDVPIVFLTALSDDRTLERAKETEPYNYLLKPFHDNELRITIEMALDKHSRDTRKQEQQKWYQAVLASMGEAVLVIDKKGIVTYCNEIAAKFFKQEINELQHSNVRHLITVHKEKSDRIIDNLASIFNGDALSVSLQVEFTGPSPDTPGMIIASPVRIDPSIISGATLIIHSEASSGKTQDTTDASAGIKLDVPLAIHDPFILQCLTNAPTIRQQGTNIVRTFGDFKMRIEEQDIKLTEWRSKKALDVLAFLILHYPSPVHKEMLINFLWPDIDVNTGISRLHHVVSELRKYLSPESQRYKRHSYVQYSHNEYRFDPQDQVVLDLVMFEELVKVGNRMWNSDNRKRAKEFYEEALLWKTGDLFPKYRYDEEFEDKRDAMNLLEETAQERLEKMS